MLEARRGCRDLEGWRNPLRVRLLGLGTRLAKPWLDWVPLDVLALVGHLPGVRTQR